MTKKIIMFASICLLTTSCLFGCGNDPKKSDDNATTAAKVEDTTKADVATTESTTAEPTTEEPTNEELTTEETSTEYVEKGERFIVDSSLKDYFMDLTIQKGDKIYLNDIIGKDDGSDEERGIVGYKLVNVLFYKNNIEKYNEFVGAYEVVGTNEYSVPYDKNVVIEYNGDKKMYFHFVKDGKKTVLFDVYEID